MNQLHYNAQGEFYTVNENDKEHFTIEHMTDSEKPLDVTNLINLATVATGIIKDGKLTVPATVNVIGGSATDKNIENGAKETVITSGGISFGRDWDSGTWSGKINSTKEFGLFISGSRINPGDKRRIVLEDDVKIGNKLCIGNTCIEEDHLKALTGQIDIGIRQHNTQAYLVKDNGSTVNDDKWMNAGFKNNDKGDWAKMRFQILK
jgi:hypothetical protein